jgi:hypothetical protein
MLTSGSSECLTAFRLTFPVAVAAASITCSRSRREMPAHSSSSLPDGSFPFHAADADAKNWVVDGVEPPGSQMPSISWDTLVPLGAVRFPKIPGVGFPARMHKPYRADYGPEFRSKGIVTIDPPTLGTAYPVFVPQVDIDENETSGIRLPVIQVPLGTYTGGICAIRQSALPMSCTVWSDLRLRLLGQPRSGNGAVILANPHRKHTAAAMITCGGSAMRQSRLQRTDIFWSVISL